MGTSDVVNSTYLAVNVGRGSAFLIATLFFLSTSRRIMRQAASSLQKLASESSFCQVPPEQKTTIHVDNAEVVLQSCRDRSLGTATRPLL